MSDLSEGMQNTFSNQSTTVANQVAQQIVHGGIEIYQDSSQNRQLGPYSPFHNAVSARS